MMQQNSSPWKSFTGSIFNKTPEKQLNDGLSINGSPLPNTFKFTPSKGKKLYPHLNPPDSLPISSSLNSSPVHNIDQNESYINKDNQSFINAMDSLQSQMFSSNISNKVMNEFSSRYEKVREEKINVMHELNMNTTNEELNRRASGRFASTHRNRFNRMESIAFHYTSKRLKEKEIEEQKEKIKESKKKADQQRLLVVPRDIANVDELTIDDKPDMVYSTPGYKRNDFKKLESATKRIKLPDSTYKEIDSSPTKSNFEREELKSMHQNRNIPTYLQPTKASLSKSTSRSSLNINLNQPILAPNQPKSISRSPSISPTRGLSRGNGLSKISPSKAYSNLNQILTSSPEKLPSPEKSTDRNQSTTINTTNTLRAKTTQLPRSKTTNISTIDRSKTLPNSVSARSFTTSSSIPRLASLVNAESRIKNESKNDLNVKKWRY